MQEWIYLGLDPVLHHEYMWLVDAALAPPLPVGWMRKSVYPQGEYYWNALCGLAQWEHPFISYVTGVVERVREIVARQEAAQKEAMRAKVLSSAARPSSAEKGRTSTAGKVGKGGATHTGGA